MLERATIKTVLLFVAHVGEAITIKAFISTPFNINSLEQLCTYHNSIAFYYGLGLQLNSVDTLTASALVWQAELTFIHNC